MYWLPRLGRDSYYLYTNINGNSARLLGICRVNPIAIQNSYLRSLLAEDEQYTEINTYDLNSRPHEKHGSLE